VITELVVRNQATKKTRLNDPNPNVPRLVTCRPEVNEPPRTFDQNRRGLNL
jgi:hypothetical protein